MLTEAHFQAGRAVRRALDRAEQAHPDSPHLATLHQRLAELRDTFRSDLPDDQFIALGGGTPKTPTDEG